MSVTTPRAAAARPCRACPWVVGRSAADIPGYDHDLAEALAVTSPDARGCGPEFGAPLFACHDSREQQPFACAGWLASVGAAHPAVRLAVMGGRIAPEQLKPAPGWPRLHRTFSAVIRNLRATRPEVAR